MVRIPRVLERQELVRDLDLAPAPPRRHLRDSVPPVAQRARDSATFPEA